MVITHVVVRVRVTSSIFNTPHKPSLTSICNRLAEQSEQFFINCWSDSSSQPLLHQVWSGTSNRCINTFSGAHDGFEVCSAIISDNSKVEGGWKGLGCVVVGEIRRGRRREGGLGCVVVGEIRRGGREGLGCVVVGEIRRREGVESVFLTA